MPATPTEASVQLEERAGAGGGPSNSGDQGRRPRAVGTVTTLSPLLPRIHRRLLTPEQHRFAPHGPLDCVPKGKSAWKQPLAIKPESFEGQHYVT